MSSLILWGEGPGARSTAGRVGAPLTLQGLPAVGAPAPVLGAGSLALTAQPRDHGTLHPERKDTPEREEAMLSTEENVPEVPVHTPSYHSPDRV